MYSELVYKHSNPPKVTSDYWDDPVRELFELYMDYRDASLELRETVWPDCIRAYMCKAELPYNPGMVWINQSGRGPTNIWEGVNDRAKSLVNNQMPRGEDWMALLATAAEDQSVTNDVKDYILSLLRATDLRGNYEKHYKQMLILGTSPLAYRWERRYQQQSFGPAETLRILDHHGIPLEPGEDISETHDQYSFPVMNFNGPVIAPINMFDTFIDPTADLSNQQTLSTIIRQYWTPEDLKRAVDKKGKPRFQNLDDLQPLTVDQIYNHDSAYRFESQSALGINTFTTRNKHQKYVPVYIFHNQVRTFDSVDETYVDTYFYVANSGSMYGNKLIAIETNPSNSGHKSVFIDTYEDWVDGAYGIGAVEKSLQDFTNLHIMSELHLNGSVGTIFPAQNVIGGVLQDDRNLKLYPGGINTINKTSVGLDFMKPVPLNESAGLLGSQAEEWYAQKIGTQVGAKGAALNAPTKTPQQSKTATQVNTESTQGSVADTCLLERSEIRTLEPIIQATYDDARQYAVDDIIQYEKARNGTLSMSTLSRAVLDAARKVVVTGYHANMNKQAEIEERREALGVLTTGNAMQILPNGTAILQKLVLSLLGRLNVPGLDQLEQDPVQLVMQDPRVQQELNQTTTQQAQQMILQLTGQAPPGEVTQNIPPPPNTPQQDPNSSPPTPDGYAAMSQQSQQAPSTFGGASPPQQQAA